MQRAPSAIWMCPSLSSRHAIVSVVESGRTGAWTWVHTGSTAPEGNPVTRLARLHGLPTLFVGGDSTYTGGWEQLLIYGKDGRPVSVAEKQESLLLVDEVRAIRSRLCAGTSLRKEDDVWLPDHPL